MERFALLFTVKPGTEEEVAHIFQSYGRPAVQANSSIQLLGTTVFIKDTIVVRVFDIEGSPEEAATFLSQQEAVRRVEEQLNPLLEHPRNFSDPEEARNFFQRSLMKRLTHREAGRPVK